MREDEEARAAAPFTEATRARLVLSSELADLADAASGLVPIGEYALREDGSATFAGEVVADVARIVGAARRALDAAVVFARLGRVTWEQVGLALDVTHQSAQERFKPVVERFREELMSPENPDYTGEFGQLRWRLAPAAREPEEAARDLDEWVLQQPRRSGDEVPDPAPVSGHLARMSPRAELAWLSDLSHQLWRDAESTTGMSLPPVAARLAIAERLEQVWQLIADEEKRDSRAHRASRATRDGLAHARRVATELRAQVAAEGEPAAEPDSEQD